MALSVIHGPVILNERYPNDALAAADPGSTVRIVLILIPLILTFTLPHQLTALMGQQGK